MLQEPLIGLSFDDGRVDAHRNAFPLLAEGGLPATFNITTQYVLRRDPSVVKTTRPPMTPAMVREIHAHPLMEIAGHGAFHQGTADDILRGIRELRDMLQTYHLCHGASGFATPGTGTSAQAYAAMRPALAAEGVCYMRSSLRYRSHPALKTLLRKVSRAVPVPTLYEAAYRDTLMAASDDVLYAVPVLSSTPVASLKAVVRSACRHRSACIFMFHSIVERSELADNWCYAADRFRDFCHFLAAQQAAGRLRVATSMNIYRQLTNGRDGHREA